MNDKKDFLDAIMTRRSIRDYKEGDIPAGDLENILQAGIMAPSAGNSQPWRFHAIKGKIKKRFLEVLRDTKTIPPQWHQIVLKGIETVPIALAVENPISIKKDDAPSPNVFNVFGEDKLNVAFLGSLLGTAASIENMLLAAHSLGYGSVWMSFPPILEAAKKVVEISGVMVAVLPIGHPADHQTEYVDRSRKSVDQITTFHD
jgi:nitroreductase